MYTESCTQWILNKALKKYWLLLCSPCLRWHWQRWYTHIANTKHFALLFSVFKTFQGRVFLIKRGWTILWHCLCKGSKKWNVKNYDFVCGVPDTTPAPEIMYKHAQGAQKGLTATKKEVFFQCPDVGRHTWRGPAASPRSGKAGNSPARSDPWNNQL